MDNIWNSDSCVIIAEAGLNHNGNLEEALSLIDVAKTAGADFVKFQKRDVFSLATESALNASDTRFPSLGSTYKEIRLRHEFTNEEYKVLKRHADDLEIGFMVTPFDKKSFLDLQDVGVQNYKVASHGVTNYPLLEALAESGKPVVLSTGMSSLDELEIAAQKLTFGKGNLVAMLHCVSSYPTPPSELNLKVIRTLSEQFGVRTGYSGHELGVLPTLLAVAIGATVVERHFTRDKGQEGFDHHMSLSPAELEELVQGIREVELMLGHGRKEILESEQVARAKYRLSMVASRDLNAGEKLKEVDFHFRNPGTGISPQLAPSFIGQKLKSDIAFGELILESDLG